MISRDELIEVMALALCRNDEAFDMNTYRGNKPHPRGVDNATACLDALLAALPVEEGYTKMGYEYEKLLAMKQEVEK